MVTSSCSKNSNPATIFILPYVSGTVPGLLTGLKPTLHIKDITPMDVVGGGEDAEELDTSK